MKVIFACPGPADLQEYLLGRTSEATAASVEEHLASCPQCRQQLPSIQAEDDFVADFRARADGHPLNDPLLDRLAGRLRNLLRHDVAALHARTPPAEGEATPSAAGTPSDDAEDLRSLLSPPRQSDEMGWLGGYRILKVLGTGGMGVVFLAEDVQLRRRVAVKALRPALAASAPARQRFLREAQLTAALAHDNVVAIHQVGEENGVPFLAMPLLQGETLEARLQREGRLPVAEVLRIGREAAEGLAAAHEHGLIHRDVKPANLWLEVLPGEPGASASRSRVKVLDFGLARSCDGDARLTQTGVIVGTPAYMAPEQAGGKVDHRADLFSLGCVLYRMATGQLPFQGETAYEVIAEVAMGRPRPPCELNPEAPPVLSDLILRLLEKDPDKRPQTGREVVLSLDEIGRDRPKADWVAPAASVAEPAIEKLTPFSSRRALWIAGAAALVLAGLVGVGALMVERQPTTDGNAGAQEPTDKAEKDDERPSTPAEPMPPMFPGSLVSESIPVKGVRRWDIQTDQALLPIYGLKLAADGRQLFVHYEDKIFETSR